MAMHGITSLNKLQWEKSELQKTQDKRAAPRHRGRFVSHLIVSASDSNSLIFVHNSITRCYKSTTPKIEVASKEWTSTVNTSPCTLRSSAEAIVEHMAMHGITSLNKLQWEKSELYKSPRQTGDSKT